MLSEQEKKQFIFSTLEHLYNLYEDGSEIVLEREKLAQGIKLLEEAFGFDLFNEDHKFGYSLHSSNPNLSMPRIISTNVHPTHCTPQNVKTFIQKKKIYTRQKES